MRVIYKIIKKDAACVTKTFQGINSIGPSTPMTFKLKLGNELYLWNQ